MKNLVLQIVDLWSDINPVVGYTSGHLRSLNKLFKQTMENVEIMRSRIRILRSQLNEITDEDLRLTADAILTSLKTQLDMPRPSGAGPSGTCMGGIGAAGDGVFYILLKKEHNKDFVATYLQAVKETVEFETQRWRGQDFTILVCKECLNTATYLEGTLESLKKVRSDMDQAIDKIKVALEKYKDIFLVDTKLSSDNFTDYWPLFQEWDANAGPAQTIGYPLCLKNYYQLDKTADEIETMAQSWLDLDMAVTIDITQRIAMLPFVGSEGNLQTIWDKVTKQYSVDFGKCCENVIEACKNYGAQYIISFNKDDKVDFAPTPDYLASLITGGGDYAINYLDPKTAFSQLYLTQSKNTSLLTMINILVHEASHGYNFVLSAKYAKSPLLNLNTALEVPMTEGMAFYREYQYWAAAQNLLGQTNLNEEQKAYLVLYGDTPKEQEQGVLCAQLETYIWRVIRYIRALCDVKVNGGKMTYTEFISWAAQTTGLSEETLHGECFTLLASPGYAPCYALGCVSYAYFQKKGISNGISEINFNTFASKQGFYSWPLGKKMLDEYVSMHLR
jgi:hypothetical protein